MFRALLAHPQEALHKHRLIYCMRFYQLAATSIGVKLVAANRHNTHAVYQVLFVYRLLRMSK
jgi:hypothetical protein